MLFQIYSFFHLSSSLALSAKIAYNGEAAWRRGGDFRTTFQIRTSASPCAKPLVVRSAFSRVLSLSTAFSCFTKFSDCTAFSGRLSFLVSLSECNQFSGSCSFALLFRAVQLSPRYYLFLLRFQGAINFRAVVISYYFFGL